MFEIKVACSRENTDLALMLWNKLEKNMNLFKGVSINNNKNFIIIDITTNSKNHDFVCSYLRNICSNIIIKYFKNQYIKQNLEVVINDEFARAALYSALTNFDKKSDEKLIKQKLALGEIIYLDSFFNFMSADIKKRWQEICEIMQENINILLLSNSIYDLIRYLVKSIEPEIDNVYLAMGEKGVAIKDFEGNNIVFYNDFDSNETNIIEKLIDLSPAKVHLKYEQSRYNNIVDKINDIFCEKVCK